MSGPAGPAPAEHNAPRLVEVVAAMSLAADLGLGLEMEHGLRACLISTRLADRLELDQEALDDTYWVSLLAMVGCLSDGFELRPMFGDDLALRAGMFEAGPSQLSLARYFLSRAGSDGGPVHRVTTGARLMATGMRAITESMATHCQVTGRLAEELGLGASIREPLQHTFERWDGKGVPQGLSGEEIALPSRIFTVANYAEPTHRLHGADAAVELLDRHAGKTLDPSVVAALASAIDILDDLGEGSWEQVVEGEPRARARLVGSSFDTALEALSRFADMRSPWFAGHSRAVAELAELATRQAKLDDKEVARLRRAALVHSLGRAGIPNTIWDKSAGLTHSERERMQLYPYYTDRILRRGSLAEYADTASASQERIDGSGYPRGLAGTAIPLPARLLAAADVYRSLAEDRPYRSALDDAAAAEHLRSDAKAGRLDADAVEAVLAAAGHQPPRRPSAPADLTPREVEVLRLVARGRTTAQIAHELSISPKTVGTHIEHIYSKIDASNRSVATLFAMQNGLV